MTKANEHILRLDRAAGRRDSGRLLEPDAASRAELADTMGLSALPKLRFDARVTPVGSSDWRLDALLGATVVQPCVATLAPVTTRIDETVERIYSARADVPEAGTEIEMPEDDRVEPLPAAVDLWTVMTEALSLALPLYPRADDAGDTDAARTAPPGVTPLTDADVHPFAGLAALRDRMDDDEPD